MVSGNVSRAVRSVIRTACTKLQLPEAHLFVFGTELHLVSALLRYCAAYLPVVTSWAAFVKMDGDIIARLGQILRLCNNGFWVLVAEQNISNFGIG